MHSWAAERIALYSRCFRRTRIRKAGLCLLFLDSNSENVLSGKFAALHVKCNMASIVELQVRKRMRKTQTWNTWPFRCAQPLPFRASFNDCGGATNRSYAHVQCRQRTAEAWFSPVQWLLLWLLLLLVIILRGVWLFHCSCARRGVDTRSLHGVYVCMCVYTLPLFLSLSLFATLCLSFVSYSTNSRYSFCFQHCSCNNQPLGILRFSLHASI